LIRGRTVTCHPHIRVEVEAGGGIFSQKPAVRDGKLVTAQSWRNHPEFYREVFACLGEAITASNRSGSKLGLRV
jgi:protease I